MIRSSLRCSSIILLLSLSLPPAAAQTLGGHFPLDHREPAGVAAHWSTITQPGLYGYVQPVRIALPGPGTVTFYDASRPDGIAGPAPAQAGMMVGHVYRVKIGGMPQFPGVELYPTIEVVDRLHPPAELYDEYPIPVEITFEEIEQALNDQMVTKVIYLENPELATPQRQEEGVHVSELPPTTNLIETATRLGRPMAILRLGGRTPSPNGPDELMQPTAPISIP